MSPELFDPFDRTVQEDPYPIYKVLRDQHPVYQNSSRGFFAVSRHADVQSLARQPAVFMSGRGITLDDMGTAAIPMLLTMDPPRHHELRRLVNRAFMSSRIADFEGFVRGAVIAALRATSGAETFDGVEGLAAKVPMDTIATLIGVPREDLPAFRGWVRRLFGVDLAGGDLSAEVVEVIGALVLYINDLIEERKKNPAEDLASELIAAEEEGRQLSHDELVGFLVMLLAAGIETTTNLLSNTLVLLARHSDVRRALVADRTLVAGAVEEILRYDTPVPGFFRTTSQDVDLHDVEIPAGSKVLLMYGSANRDDRVYSQPDRFDINRSGEPHLAFGSGAHFCLGAALARLECKVVVEQLLDFGPDWEVDTDSAQRIHSPYARGYTSLPVTFEGRKQTVPA